MVKIHSLFDFPSILFYSFLGGLGIREVEKFSFIYNNNHKILCEYAVIKKSHYEQPTLVLVDLRSITGINVVKVLLLSTTPEITTKGEVDTLDYQRSVIVSENNGQLKLEVNLGYLGKMEIGDNATKLTNNYLLSLAQMTIELNESKKYDWVRSVAK